MNWNPPAFPTAPVGNSTKQPATTEFVTQAIGSAAISSFVDFVSGIISSPKAQDYRIILSLPVAVTFTNFVTQVGSGTLTAKLQISDSDIPGSTIAVTSSIASTLMTTSNTAAVAAFIDLSITTTSGVAGFDFYFTVYFSRAP